MTSPQAAFGHGRPLRSVLVGTPSTTSTPAFGRVLTELVFVLRAHGIDVREAPYGMTLMQAYLKVPASSRPDAVVWIEGDLEVLQEDLVSLVEAVKHVEVASLLVPKTTKRLDFAWIRKAAKTKATLSELEAAGLEFDVDLYPPHEGGLVPSPKTWLSEIQTFAGKKFRKVERVGPGAVAVRREALDFAMTRQHQDAGSSDSRVIHEACMSSGGAWLSTVAPIKCHVPGGFSYVSKEPEFSIKLLEKKQAPVIERPDIWRSQAWRGVAITTIAFDPKVADIFAPVATMLCEGLREAGFKAVVSAPNTIDRWLRDEHGQENSDVQPLHVILGAHIAEVDVDIPEGSIFYCAEQPAPAWVEFIEGEARLYRPSVIWSWAESTTRALREAKLPAITVPLGHVKGLESEFKLEPGQPKDIDVLFFGGMTERRRRILGRLASLGLKIHYEKAVWGMKREALLARSKVVLNIHGNDMDDVNIFEVVRVLPLMAKGCTVVSEKGEGWERFAAGCAFVDKEDEIPGVVEALVRDPERVALLAPLVAARDNPQAAIFRKLFFGMGN